MRKVFVVGIGNLLLKDEGVGIRVLDHLEKEGGLPEQVELLQGETGGLALLPSLEGADGIIFVDAAEFEGRPGEVRIFKNEAVQKARYTPLSVHDIGLRDLISLLSLKSVSAPEIVVVGIKPIEIGIGVEISSELEKAIPSIVTVIRAEIDGLVKRLRA